MKKIVLFTSLFITTNIFADELQTFDQVKEAVITGKTIHIGIDFAKCSSQKMDEQMMIGVFTPNVINVVNHSIATSFTHFTLNNPNFLEKPVYEFVRYTITEDSNVRLTVQVLDATNYKPLTNKLTFNCKINAGAKIYN